MVGSVNELSQAELNELKIELEAEYSEFASRNLALNMARGKPSGKLLDHNVDVLKTLENPFAADGTDARNYGILEGLPEMRKFFAEVLNLDPERIIVGGNSSLTLMYDSIVRLMMFGSCGNPAWRTLPKVKFLCPSPGYDRHFAITQEFGIEMITVPMTENGPDMDIIEELVANDDAVKGMWCVPLYSNPQGVCYSDETVERLGKMKTAAKDFKIFWDNAYGVHHIYEEVKLADIFSACERGGNPDRVYYFFSTSKITFPGAGVAMMAASLNERNEILKRMNIQTIGSDKLNQLRTLRTLKDAPTLKKHMAELADILRPKFDIVLNTLDAELSAGNFASWIKPRGGYFVSLDTMDGCAKKTLELAKNAGVTMTGAGATFPYKNDPRDRNIRIAPTFPTDEELQTAMKLFCVCVKLAAVKKMIGEF